MAAELDISLDLTNLARLRTLRSASRLMAAKALTFSAEAAKEPWRAANHRVFHMRRNWIDKGVQVRAATPATMTAQVGSVDKYMGRHVVGVDEPKKAGHGKLFVPVKPIEEQGTHTQIRAALRRMQDTLRKPFMRHGVLLRRLRKASDSPFQVLAVLRSEVDIKPRLDALPLVAGAVNRAFPSVYERLLLKWADSGQA